MQSIDRQVLTNFQKIFGIYSVQISEDNKEYTLSSNGNTYKIKKSINKTSSKKFIR